MSSSPQSPAATGPVAALSEACGLLDELADTMWAARLGPELTGTVEVLARLRAKLDAVELAVVRELDVSESGRAAVKQAGWASTKDYLTHTAGGRNGAGGAAVRLAERMDRFPVLADAMADGWLSRTKAQIIVAAVDRLPLDLELRGKALQVLLEQARSLSAHDLERAGRHVLEVVDPGGVDAALERDLERAERVAHLNRSLPTRFDRLGGGSGAFAGSVEDVLLLKTVLLSLAHLTPPSLASAVGTASAETRCAGTEGTMATTSVTTVPGCSTRSSSWRGWRKAPGPCPTATVGCRRSRSPSTSTTCAGSSGRQPRRSERTSTPARSVGWPATPTFCPASSVPTARSSMWAACSGW